jgi:ArsR family transcriptional regulator
VLNKKELTAFNKALGGRESDRLPVVFDALAEPTRCKIARLLINKAKRKLSVGDIAEVLGISQSSASQHLKILEVTGIVVKKREGRHRFYDINRADPIVAALTKAVM